MEYHGSYGLKSTKAVFCPASDPRGPFDTEHPEGKSQMLSLPIYPIGKKAPCWDFKGAF